LVSFIKTAPKTGNLVSKLHVFMILMLLYF